MTQTTAPARDARPVDEDGFDSLDPATGQVLATWPRRSAAEVEQTVLRAREASAWWQAQGPEARRRHLRAWKGVLARRLHELADLVHRENGKPHADAVLEITLAVDHIEWAAKHAAKVLGPPTRPPRCSTSRSA